MVVASMPSGPAHWRRSLEARTARAEPYRARPKRESTRDAPRDERDNADSPPQRYPETDEPFEPDDEARDDAEEFGDDAQSLSGTEMLAKVGGSEIILRGDLRPVVDEQIRMILKKNADRKISERDINQLREHLTRQALDSAITTKLTLVAARTKFTDQKVGENLESIGQLFDDRELPLRLKQHKVRNAVELNEFYLRHGTSLERERTAFCEQTLARSWIGKAIEFDREVTHEQMLAHYREHLEEYNVEARARWEHLKVRYVQSRQRSDPLRARADLLGDRDASRQLSRGEAYDLLAEMGNEALDGRSFAELAKEHSTCSCRASEAVHDWTTPGTMAFEQLDEAIFTLPVDSMSEILDDERGELHIIRVIEREDAGVKPFEELQGELRTKITTQRRLREMKKYIAELREKIPVWTIYDEARPREQETAGAGTRRR